MTILSATAVCFDLRKNIIPNRLIFSGTGIGILIRVTTDILERKPSDILIMAVEVIVLFIILWPAYTAGGLGAGDCKLLLMIGVFLPVKQTIFIVAGTFIVAAAEVVLLRLFYGTKRGSIRLTPAIFTAVLLSWL